MADRLRIVVIGLPELGHLLEEAKPHGADVVTIPRGSDVGAVLADKARGATTETLLFVVADSGDEAVSRLSDTLARAGFRGVVLAGLPGASGTFAAHENLQVLPAPFSANDVLAALSALPGDVPFFLPVAGGDRTFGELAPVIDARAAVAAGGRRERNGVLFPRRSAPDDDPLGPPVRAVPLPPLPPPPPQGPGLLAPPPPGPMPGPGVFPDAARRAPIPPPSPRVSAPPPPTLVQPPPPSSTPIPTDDTDDTPPAGVTQIFATPPGAAATSSTRDDEPTPIGEPRAELLPTDPPPPVAEAESSPSEPVSPVGLSDAGVPPAPVVELSPSDPPSVVQPAGVAEPSPPTAEPLAEAGSSQRLSDLGVPPAPVVDLPPSDPSPVAVQPAGPAERSPLAVEAESSLSEPLPEPVPPVGLFEVGVPPAPVVESLPSDPSPVAVQPAGPAERSPLAVEAESSLSEPGPEPVPRRPRWSSRCRAIRRRWRCSRPGWPSDRRLAAG